MSNLEDTFKLRYPEYTVVLRLATPHYCRLTDFEIEKLWERFSGEHCAQWLGINERSLKSFDEWVRE